MWTHRDWGSMNKTCMGLHQVPACIWCLEVQCVYGFSEHAREWVLILMPYLGLISFSLFILSNIDVLVFILPYILFKRKEDEISMKTSHWNNKVNYLQSNRWPSTNLICYTTVMLISVQIVVGEVFWGRKCKPRREGRIPFFQYKKWKDCGMSKW